MGALKNPLVWVDLETTGVKYRSDLILQICCVITDSNLNIVSPYFQRVIGVPAERLQKMKPYVRQMHRKSGLISKCKHAKMTIKEADEDMAEFLKTHLGPKALGTIAGNTVHFDKTFMHMQMPKTTDRLNYRILDVSSINEFGLRHNPDLIAQRPKKKHLHEAKADIIESIAELRWYKDNYFVQPKEQHEDEQDAGSLAKKLGDLW